MKDKIFFTITTILLLNISSPLFAFIFGNKINQGNSLYKKQQYEAAETKYREAIAKKENPVANFNIGNSLYRQEKYDESEKSYDLIISNDKVNKNLRQKAFYNKGNSQFRQGNYEEAIKSYEEALKLNPRDEDAKYNLEIAKKMLQLPKEKRQQQQQKNQQQEKNNEKKSSAGKEKNQKETAQQQQQPNTQENKGQKLSREDAERILQGLSNQEKHKNIPPDKKGLIRKGEASVEKDW